MSSLFLDANVLLDFFRFGDDDISEVAKIVALISGKEITLYINEQLENEFERNRERVLVESFSSIKSSKISLRTPNYCTSFPELAALNVSLKTAGKAHADLITSIEQKLRNRELPADKLIGSLFKDAKKIAIGTDIIAKARLRLDLGNPPGKKGSIGDAIHWECLLSLQSGYSVDLVSRDSDFASELDGTKISNFLTNEWQTKFGKHSSINLFPSLGSFLRARFPNIKLSEESEKEELIGRLEASENFSSTHALIAQLEAYSFFTTDQACRLFEILVRNNQVGWIATDPDVFDFFKKIRTKAGQLPTGLQDDAAGLLEVDSEEYFFPF
jgi:PIN domain